MADTTAEKITRSRKEIENLVKRLNDSADDETSVRFNYALRDYCSLAKKQAFEKCMDTDNPMLAAIMMMEFKIIEKTVTWNEVEGMKYGLEKWTYPINLLELHKEVPGGIGYAGNWQHVLQKFNFLLTAQKAVDLGISPAEILPSNSSSAMKNALILDMSPMETHILYSTTRDAIVEETKKGEINLLKTLTMVVQSMLGEEVTIGGKTIKIKPTSYDVNYLMRTCFRSRRKSLTITFPDYNILIKHIAEICHRIVTGANYCVECRIAKHSNAE